MILRQSHLIQIKEMVILGQLCSKDAEFRIYTNNRSKWQSHSPHLSPSSHYRGKNYKVIGLRYTCTCINKFQSARKLNSFFIATVIKSMSSMLWQHNWKNKENKMSNYPIFILFFSSYDLSVQKITYLTCPVLAPQCFLPPLPATQIQKKYLSNLMTKSPQNKFLPKENFISDFFN